MPAATPEQLDAVERWFLSRGMPHLIEDYTEEAAVWTRAVPSLVVAYLVLVGLQVWATDRTDVVVGAAISVGVVAVTWVVSNLLRRRAPFARIQQVGAVELGVWLIGVSVPEVAQRDWAGLAYYAGFGLVVLFGVYVVTVYGVVPLLGWVGTRILRSLPDVRVAAARALPMLLLFVTFFFLTAETWQTFARFEGVAYGLALGLFVAVGVAFVWSRLRPDVEGLESFTSWAEVVELAAATPAAALAVEVDGSGLPDAPDLDRRQRVNALLVAVGGQTILAVLVAAVMGAFFMVFGVLVVDEALIASWVGGPAHVFVGVTVSGRRLVLTEELIRVSGFLATFSGFYFGVFSVTDPTFRQGLTDDSADSLREALAARLLYLRARPAVMVDHI